MQHYFEKGLGPPFGCAKAKLPWNMEGSAICLWKCTNERRTVVLQCQFAIWGTRLVFLRNGCPLVPKPGRVHKALAARRDVKKASMFCWLDLLTGARRHLWSPAHSIFFKRRHPTLEANTRELGYSSGMYSCAKVYEKP